MYREIDFTYLFICGNFCSILSFFSFRVMENFTLKHIVRCSWNLKLCVAINLGFCLIGFETSGPKIVALICCFGWWQDNKIVNKPRTKYLGLTLIQLVSDHHPIYNIFRSLILKFILWLVFMANMTDARSHWLILGRYSRVMLPRCETKAKSENWNKPLFNLESSVLRENFKPRLWRIDLTLSK